MNCKTQNLMVMTIIFLSFSSIYAQINVDIDDMYYASTGESINHCGAIDLGDNTSVTVKFFVELEKEANNALGNSSLTIYTKYEPNSLPDAKQSQTVLSNQWSDNEHYTTDFSITLYASELAVDGSSLYAELETYSGLKYSSCPYWIQKEEVPTFTLSPSSWSLDCGDTPQKTFKVTNDGNLTGVTYQWDVGNGWSGNVGNGNSITLTPSSGTALPSDVSVTPIYNGEDQSTLTCDVSRSDFLPSASITGSNSLCSTATYSVNNLPNGVSVSSWSISNPNIVSISENGDQASLTATGNGTLTLSATLLNSCGQTVNIEKNNIYVGSPDVSGASLDTGWPHDIETNTVSHIIVTKSFPDNFTYHWEITPRQNDCDQAHFPIPGQPGSSTNSITTNDESVPVFWGNSCGGGYKIECWVENECGQRYIGEVIVQVKYVDCLEVSVSPNPVKSGAAQPLNLSLKLLPPCDGSGKGSPITIEDPIHGSIYNISGQLEYEDDLNGRNGNYTINGLSLPSGMHIIKVTTAKGLHANTVLLKE